MSRPDSAINLTDARHDDATTSGMVSPTRLSPRPRASSNQPQPSHDPLGEAENPTPAANPYELDSVEQSRWAAQLCKEVPGTTETAALEYLQKCGWHFQWALTTAVCHRQVAQLRDKDDEVKQMKGKADAERRLLYNIANNLAATREELDSVNAHNKGVQDKSKELIRSVEEAQAALAEERIKVKSLESHRQMDVVVLRQEDKNAREMQRYIQALKDENTQLHQEVAALKGMERPKEQCDRCAKLLGELNTVKQACSSKCAALEAKYREQLKAKNAELDSKITNLMEQIESRYGVSRRGLVGCVMTPHTTPKKEPRSEPFQFSLDGAARSPSVDANEPVMAFGNTSLPSSPFPTTASPIPPPVARRLPEPDVVASAFDDGVASVDHSGEEI